LKTAEDAQQEAVCLEAVASEAPEGNTNSYTTADEIILVESGTSSETRTSSASLSSSSSTSSDPDDIPLSKVYTTLNKALSPSPSTKTSKKPDYYTFVPMYPSVEERLIGLQQRRIDACIHLPADCNAHFELFSYLIYLKSLDIFIYLMRSEELRFV